MHNKSYKKWCYHSCNYKYEKNNVLNSMIYKYNFIRSSDYETRGQGFESFRAHQFFLFLYHKGLLKFDTSTHQED